MSGSGREYLVDFNKRSCTCGKWQHFRAPCPEVIACGVADETFTNDRGVFMRAVGEHAPSNY